MSAPAWNPRGEPTFPNVRTAKPGTIVEHVRTGARGTIERIVVGRTSRARMQYAVVRWHNDSMGRPTDDVARQVVGRVVAPAYDLRRAS